MNSVILDTLKQQFKPTGRKLFAGIGPRHITSDQYARIENVSYQMSRNGYFLRSGGARGSDDAFEVGNTFAVLSQREIFIPWNRFKQDHTNPCSKTYVEDGVNVFKFNSDLDQILNRLVSDFHPKYNDLTRGPLALMKRNCHQILGYNLNDPVELVITDANAYYDDQNRIKDCKGGTGFAVRLAYALEIPIYNLSETIHLNILLDKYNITL